MATLDDVLSTVEGMHFFGKTTKSYNKSNDPDSGSYCTIPVRYDFADKDTRLYAESVLREHCKVQCTTPYPTILREAIKQVMNKVKKDYPNNYVRVQVDTGNMYFKVARRPHVDEKTGGKKEWFNVTSALHIPTEALDVSARKVPEGFQVKWPNEKNRSNSTSSSSSSSSSGSSMDLPDDQHEQQTSATTSPPRKTSPRKSREREKEK
jgi:hypothetical protein